MFIYKILLSRKILVCIVIVSIISLVLTFVPLVGKLGFEYSFVIAFISSFICVFISAEYVNIDLRVIYPGKRRYSDLISICFLINFTILLFPFLIGLVSSLLKSDCYLREGLIFFLVMPVVTVIFSSSVGLLSGYLFPKRGFFIGSIIILLIIFYSLWILYSDPPIYSYNHIVGFFPGPIYDQVIPIDHNLVIFRVISICWAIFLLLCLKLKHDYRNGTTGAGTVILSVIFATVLLASMVFSNELGIRHTRQYLIDHYFTDSYETEHFIIYFFPGSIVSKHVDLVAFDHEFRYAQLTKYLDLKDTGKIVSYVYPDVDTRKKLIGAGNTTIANPIHREMHIIYDSFPNPVLKHELTHVLSSDFGTGIMKISPKIGLVEGLAVAADWEEVEGYNPHHWARSILNMDNGISVKDLVGWGFWAAPASKSYTLMGSFVRYLIDKYGVEKFKQVYKSGNFELYGISLDNLIADWEKYLQKIVITSDMPSITMRIYGSPSIFTDTCPRKSSYYSELGIKEYENMNFYQASKYFEKAFRYNPTNNYILESLAYSYFQDSKYENVEQVAENNKQLPDISKNIIRNLIGNIRWKEGKTVQAEEIFTQLKQSVLPLDISNELSIKIDAIRRGNEIGRGIIDYYSNQDKVKRVAILEGLIRQFPSYSVPYYLLGKLFFYKWDFQSALVYLKQSEKIGLPSDNLNVDNERLLGTSLFVNCDYDESSEIYSRILHKKSEGRYYNFAEDFLERIDWMRKAARELNE